MRETEFIAHINGRETNIDRAKMAEVSKIKTEKQDNPWNGESRPRRKKKKKKENRKKTTITYRRISKRLAVETTSLYCSCSITPSHHSCSSLLIKYACHSISLALRCMPAQVRPTLMPCISLVMLLCRKIFCYP